ncbi:hypothetical protein ABPG74_000913 [Tetrahymena malaccensis]
MDQPVVFYFKNKFKSISQVPQIRKFLQLSVKLNLFINLTTCQARRIMLIIKCKRQNQSSIILYNNKIQTPQQFICLLLVFQVAIYYHSIIVCIQLPMGIQIKILVLICSTKLFKWIIYFFKSIFYQHDQLVYNQLILRGLDFVCIFYLIFLDQFKVYRFSIIIKIIIYVLIDILLLFILKSFQ